MLDYQFHVFASASHSYDDLPNLQEVYPSQEFKDGYHAFTPILLVIVIASTLFAVSLVFLLYDVSVARRNDKITANAVASNALVTAMFPGQLRERIMQHEERKPAKKSHLKHFLSVRQDGIDAADDYIDTNCIADIFLETTVIFVDLVGFTAWSSAREPSHVFVLLEHVYRAFDQRAKHRRIFKVETVGDCYVAVAGLPDPRADHAISIARFARECLRDLRAVTKKLVAVLGPDTSELNARIGIHSGPVTAGVLRGERSRFQLFGDTMNMASRMESTGQAGRIHVSSETAALLVASGKEHWVKPREEEVSIKGKGTVTTSWLLVSDDDTRSTYSGTVSSSSRTTDDNHDRWGAEHTNLDREPAVDKENMMRLVEWNCQIMLKIIKQMM